ncbi:MAG: DUF4412 domain-containing protein [Desulfonatronovibrio sp.]
MTKYWSEVSLMSILCLFVLSVSYASASVPFQADYVQMMDGEEYTGKYYAGPDGIRIEGIMDGQEQLMIINFEKGVTWVVMKSEGMYMEMPFNPEDSEEFRSPCAQLNVKKNMVGREKMQGRKVEKWHCELAMGGTDQIWFDPRLKAAIRTLESSGEVFELRNIKEGRLSKDLFQLPAGYTKMSMPGLEEGAYGQGMDY